MTIDELKNALKKEATIFSTGGKRPSRELGESWIGAVYWQAEGEQLPKNEEGQDLEPLMMLFLKDLAYVPPALQQFEMLAIYLDLSIWDHLVTGELSSSFVVRAYTSILNLTACDYTASTMQPYPFISNYVDNDFPTWEGLAIDDVISNKIAQLEEEELLDYYDDIFEENYAIHKLGGYPAFRQSGVDFGDAFPFVLQIASDFKAGLNIVDDGNFYFFYNAESGHWKVYCDFY